MANPPLIAVIDDDEGVRKSLDGLVRSLGYRVATFDSAEEFFRSGEALESRCVISDIRMSGMDGIALTQRLGESDGNKVILITAFLNDAATKQARAAGARCLLGKPFDPDVLIRCIEDALAA